ncbi:hypothetical protein PCK1_000039 [Pneumocystis canis]|nr:hypothetical protein PCK1_000039 [Pneumocystis canis]
MEDNAFDSNLLSFSSFIDYYCTGNNYNDDDFVKKIDSIKEYIQGFDNFKCNALCTILNKLRKPCVTNGTKNY